MNYISILAVVVEKRSIELIISFTNWPIGLWLNILTWMMFILNIKDIIKINTYKRKNFFWIFFALTRTLLPSLCISEGMLKHKNLLFQSWLSSPSGSKSSFEGIKCHFYAVQRVPFQWRNTNHQCMSSSIDKNFHLF